MSNNVEFDYLKQLIQYRLQTYFNKHIIAVTPKLPLFKKWGLHVPEIIKNAQLSHVEKTIIILALSPHFNEERNAMATPEEFGVGALNPA